MTTLGLRAAWAGPASAAARQAVRNTRGDMGPPEGAANGWGSWAGLSDVGAAVSRGQDHPTGGKNVRFRVGSAAESARDFTRGQTGREVRPGRRPRNERHTSKGTPVMPNLFQKLKAGHTKGQVKARDKRWEKRKAQVNLI